VNDRPRVLEQLGAELDRVARSNLAGSGALRLAPRRLSVLAVIAALLVLAAAATAAVLLIQQGPALPAPRAQDLQSSGVPLPGSVRLAGLDAPDPGGGAPPWDVRLSRTRAGETCTAVGQVLHGQFGIVGLDHVFRALPLGGADACGVNSPGGPALAGARVFVGRGAQEARTVVNGVAGDGTRAVTAYGPEGARALSLGPRGSFITVYRGRVEDVRPRIVIVTRDGRTRTIAFAQSSAFEVSDPGGGSPWQVSGEADLQPGAYPDEDCAQASREPGPEDPSRFGSSLTPEVCGRLGTQPLFVLMRRFVPGTGEGSGWPWGNNPARTLVYGAAAPRVSSLTLAGAGTTRALAIDAHGGVFLAVLDGHVDPRSLTLTAHLRDGHTLTYTHSAHLLEYELNPLERPRDRSYQLNLLEHQRDRPLAEPPVPAYRNPLPPQKTLPAPFELPLRSTVRETLRAPDPAGAGTWLLRSWQGRPNPRAKFGGAVHREPFICIQAGLARGASLLQPRASGGAQQLRLGDETGRCNQPRDLIRMTYMLQMESSLADPYAYAPRPARTVLSGELPPEATDPVLLGTGPPRALALDANHAFLVVLPGRYWHSSPHITYKLHGHTTGTGHAPRFPLGPAPTAPQARAPDPDGGAPWGFSATPDCSTAIGRIVEGRLASIDERNGVLKSGPGIWGSGGSCPTHAQPHSLPGERNRPVRFDIQQADTYVSPLEGPSREPLTPSEIQRRTLPGRTIISGIARSDVAAVTISTPTDVRTLRPAGPLHVIIAAYDGQFFRGALMATVLFKDGRTETEPLFGPAGAASLSPPRLATQLREMEAQIHGGHPDARAPHGVPEQVRVRVETIRRRIAYEHSHPGLLPAP
jgi:hypothetical protein